MCPISKSFVASGGILGFSGDFRKLSGASKGFSGVPHKISGVTQAISGDSNINWINCTAYIDLIQY